MVYQRDVEFSLERHITRDVGSILHSTSFPMKIAGTISKVSWYGSPVFWGRFLQESPGPLEACFVLNKPLHMPQTLSLNYLSSMQQIRLSNLSATPIWDIIAYTQKWDNLGPHKHSQILFANYFNGCYDQTIKRFFCLF